jgi:5'(3')-deoxyribonucleotidase
MTKPIIALDCDGVLSDWHEHAFYILNKLLDSNYSVKDLKEWDINELLEGSNISKNEFWKAINSSTMVQDLNPYPEALKGVAKLKEIADIYVCTSPMVHYHNWIIHRNTWLKKHFDIDSKKVIHTSAKYLISANIFVDDHPNNVQKWSDRQNGIAVLWKHNYNSAHEGKNRAIYTNDWDLLEAITLKLKNNL